MSDQRPPARPWYDLVTEEMAVRGWGIAELARRAGIGRPTIYGWRDNMAKPQPAPVNAAADALGIDRRRALRLAGVLDARPEPEIPQEVIDEYGDKTAQDIAESVPDPVLLAEIFAAMLRRRRGEPEPPTTGPGATTPPGGSRRAV